MAIKTYFKVAAALLLAAAIGIAAVVIAVPRLLDLDSCKARILSMAQKSLGRPVSYQTASFSWQFVPSFVFRGITIAEPSGEATFLKVDRLTFKLSILPLLRKEVHLKELVFERPELILSRNRSGAFNINDLIKGKPSEFSTHLQSVRIINGLCRFTDRLPSPEGLTTSLERLDLNISGLDRGKISTFKLSAMVLDERGHSAISASGTARIPGQTESFSDASFNVTLSAKNLAPDRFWPYYGHYLPFEKVHGNLSFNGRFQGKPNEFSAKGNITINDLRLNYPRVFHTPLTPGKVRLAYELELTPRDLTVKSIDLNVDGLHAAGNCTLGDIHSGDPRITARAAISPFRLQEFRQYIPYGIIVKDVADVIEHNIAGGVYRLDEAKLDGRVSQILHMERGANYNVLSVRAHVENGLVTLGQHVPTFNNIKCELELSGKDFLVNNMTGNFGGSPFTLEGKISDYPLDTPSRYPFTMDITPAEAEVAWLLQQVKVSDIACNGRSDLNLSGSGSVTDYRLTGSWDLSDADYRYRQMLHKPSGLANQLKFTARLTEKKAQLEEFRYEISPVEVTATAAYQYNDRHPLAFAVSTNRFQVTPLLTVMPWLEKYHPSGTMETRFGGSGNPAEPDGINLKGDVALENFSVGAVDQIKPLTNISGTIHLTEAALETEQLTGTTGNSPFTVKGRVTGLHDPTADLIFSFTELHLADFGFQSPEQIPEIKNLSADISLKDNNIEITSLSGEAASSRFTMSGKFLDNGTPGITIRADFPYLRAEDLAPLARLHRAGKNGEQAPDITLNARITAAAGSIRGIAFEKFDSELTLNKSLLDVHSLTVDAFGGLISGNGKSDFSADGGPLYLASYRLDQVDATRLLSETGADHHLTGRISGAGEVAFQGRTMEELKNSARGHADMMLTDGVLKFPEDAAASRRQEFPFKKAQAHLTYARKVLDIKSAEIKAFGGVITGNGRADFGIPDGPGYRLSFHLGHIDAAAFFRAFDATRELSGTLKLDGELTAKGDSKDVFIKSLDGTVTERLVKGIIKKYGFISKVFSILNVSQLLDYRLPDVMGSGAPFNYITGTYYVKNGRVSTRDLTIHSPSLNMTIVGDADLVARSIDVKIGVQPLQTIGKVINRIPVIGWLLTGKKKSFLVVYYEAKGQWDDPKITSITMKSLPSGILNIFKRALNLPGDIVTEPGKVILGN